MVIRTQLCEDLSRLQVGLFEMKMALEASGGMAVQTDSFHNPVFINSLQRVFAKPGEPGHMGVASNAIFEVSPQWTAIGAPRSCAVPHAESQPRFAPLVLPHTAIQPLNGSAADHPVKGCQGGGAPGAGGAHREEDHRSGRHSRRNGRHHVLAACRSAA